MEQTNIAAELPAKRPQFLKVLCILTFIGAGFGVISGVFNLIKAPHALEEFEEMQELTSEMGNGGLMGTMVEYAHKAAIHALPLSITAIVVNLICLLGAWMMWKLRKAGFYIYVFGQISAIAIPAFLIGFGGVFAIMATLIPIAFIVMYALNLKHLS